MVGGSIQSGNHNRLWLPLYYALKRGCFKCVFRHIMPSTPPPDLSKKKISAADSKQPSVYYVVPYRLVAVVFADNNNYNSKEMAGE